MRYLVDTSALVRILRRQVDPHWDDMVERGLVAICEPVVVETLTIVDAKRYQQAEHELRALSIPGYRCGTTRGIWSGRSGRSWPRTASTMALSVADLLIIATAIQLKLTVLHEDADFETVARIVPQLRQERLTSPS